MSLQENQEKFAIIFNYILNLLKINKKCIDLTGASNKNNLGKFKWENLGVPYPLEGVRQATGDDIERAKKILEI